MSEASYTDVQAILGDAVSAIPLDSLTANMRFASIMVQDDGIDITQSRFKLLHVYKTASLLFDNGFIKGPVTSEAVADVSISYGGTGSTMSPWEFIYQRMKTSVQGLTDRIL